MNLLWGWTTRKVNDVLNEIKTDNITKENRLIKAFIIFVERKVGFKQNQDDALLWKSRIGK